MDQDDKEDGLGSGLGRQRFSAGKSSGHQGSNEDILERKRALFGG